MTPAPMLQEYGTQLVRLKPNNIIQAAHADLRLRERKSKEAGADEMYSFARRHVNRANNVGHLIALAFFDPQAAAMTDKKSTFVVYNDREVLRDALLAVINGGDE